MSPIPSILLLPLLGSALAALGAGVVGTLTRVRRNTYLAGAISHAVLAGIGLSEYLRVVHHITHFSPTYGALLAALLAALFIAFMQTRPTHPTDSAFSAVWVVGMALGLVLIAATPGYQGDLMNYLFGSVLLITPTDIQTMIGLNLALLLLLVLFWRGILSICFDSALSTLRGLKTRFYEILFAVMTALAVVILVQVVGIVLAIALLTLPAMTASLCTGRLIPMMLWSSAFAFIALVCGLTTSWFANIQPAAPAVLFAAAFAALATLIRYVRSRR